MRTAGRCPPPVREQLYRILFKPDKNGPEYKAVVEATRRAQRAPLDLLASVRASAERAGLFQPVYRKRQATPEYLVLVGICTHLGCSPSSKFKAGAEEGMPGDWLGGFLCPCHGSTFDMAGRVYKNKPAPDNLEVPPHMFLSDSKLLIGEDKQA